MRLFVGIEFDKAVIERLYSIQNELRAKVSRGRFPDRNNMHLTLHFLGEVANGKVRAIVSALEKVALNCQPFTLSFNKHLGYFGQSNPVRVVWVGGGGDLSNLLQLQSLVASAMQSVGYPDESRAYHPHVTLAREADFLSTELLRERGRIEYDIGPLPAIHVNRFSLISSSLEQGKRIYRPLATLELSKK